MNMVYIFDKHLTPFKKKIMSILAKECVSVMENYYKGIHFAPMTREYAAFIQLVQTVATEEIKKAKENDIKIKVEKQENEIVDNSDSNDDNDDNGDNTDNSVNNGDNNGDT